MSISKHDKMNVLLKQIQLSETIVEKHFKNSYIEKLDIYKQAKIWHFHFHIEKPLPIDIYVEFNQQLQATFKSIATIQFTLYTNDATIDNSDICHYWTYFIKNI